MNLPKNQLPDGRMAVVMAGQVVPEQTMTVPEHIEYPDLRNAYASGTFEKGDHVIVTVQVLDADGNDKTPADSVWELPLDNYVQEEEKEVLGVIYFNFTEAIKMPLSPEDGYIPEE